MKKAEITWSIMHPTPLDVEYMRALVRHARRYRVDSFELCGTCHGDLGGMEGLVHYDGYAGVADPRDKEAIDRNLDQMREILALAHSIDCPLLYWHREVMIPRSLAESLPGLLDEDQEFDLLGETYADLIRYKIDQTFRNLPELDGLVLTLTESDFSVIHNSRPDRYPPPQVVAHLVSLFTEALQARGKRFVLRSFGSIAQDYHDILAGAAEAARFHPGFEIETKITPYDFVPFLPVNPWLRAIDGATFSVECDCVGEFLGAGNLPAANVGRIVDYVRTASDLGVDRFALRLDRLNTSIFDTSYEINLRAYHRAIDDPEITAAELLQQWCEEHAPGHGDELRKLIETGMRVVEKINFIFGNVIFHTFPLHPALKWIKAGGIFALFKEHVPLAHQDGIWSIFADRDSPVSREEILAEKREATAVAAGMLQAIEELRPALVPDFHRRFLRETQTALAVSRLYEFFCRAICAYFDGMENDDADGRTLDAAMAEIRKEMTDFLPLAELDQLAPSSERATDAYHGLHEPGEPNLAGNYVRPIWQMILALREEYAIEWRNRQAILATSNTVDAIIFGAPTDEWRIRRYMHASHVVVRNDRFFREVGNTVFPNGFLEFELRRPAGKPAKLLLETYPNPKAGLRVEIDNGLLTVFPCSTGSIEIPLAANEAATVRLRLTKSGAAFPLLHSAAIRPLLSESESG